MDNYHILGVNLQNNYLQQSWVKTDMDPFGYATVDHPDKPSKKHRDVIDQALAK
jgi:hypothetical protein